MLDLQNEKKQKLTPEESILAIEWLMRISDRIDEQETDLDIRLIAIGNVTGLVIQVATDQLGERDKTISSVVKIYHDLRRQFRFNRSF